MQKLELRNYLNEILIRLKSDEIIDLIDSVTINKPKLLSLLIESKAGYDQATLNGNNITIFEQFKATKEYATANYSQILSFISQQSTISHSENLHRVTLLTNTVFSNFYSFHKSLQSTYNLLNDLLIPNKQLFDGTNAFNFNEALRNGHLVLEIIDEGNVTLKKLREVITSLENLIETVYLLFDKIEKDLFDIYPEVVMVDSGSDINFILKLPEKAANLIAQIIKEFFEFAISTKHFKHRKDLNSLEHSITVLGKIKKAKDQNIIDAETAEVLKKGIIENTRAIISRNTITQEIALETREFSNRQLVIDQSAKLLLQDKEDGD